MIRKYIEKKFNENGFFKRDFTNPNDGSDKTFTYSYIVETNIDWMVGKARAFIALCILFPLCFDSFVIDMLIKEFSMFSIATSILLNIGIIGLLFYLQFDLKRQLRIAFENSKKQVQSNGTLPVKEAWVKKKQKKLCVIFDGFPYDDTYEEYKIT